MIQFPHPDQLLPPYNYNMSGMQKGIDLIGMAKAVLAGYGTTVYLSVDVDGRTIRLWPEWGCRPLLQETGVWAYPWYMRGLAPAEAVIDLERDVPEYARADFARCINEAISSMGIIIPGIGSTVFCEVPTPWVAFDLDNTLVKQAPHFNPITFGEDIAEGVAMLNTILAEGKYAVRIFTARLDPTTPRADKSASAIISWTREKFGQTVWPTPIKDSHMILLYDDRSWRVEA